MIKILLLLTLLSFTAPVGVTHKYLVKEIPDNVEGTLFTERVYHPNDTIQILDKTFIVLKVTE